MFKKKLLSATGLAVAISLSASTAFAFPYLNPKGDTNADLDYVQLLEDAFAERLIRKNTTTGKLEFVNAVSGSLQVGDIFAGVQKIQLTELAPEEQDLPNVNLQSGSTFTSLFLNKITSISSTGDVTTLDSSYDIIDFGSAGSDAWVDVFGSGGLIDVSSVWDVEAKVGTVDPGTLALLFFGADFPSITVAGATVADSAKTYVAGAELQYEFGFTDLDADGESTVAGEFWDTKGLDAAVPASAGTNNPTIKLGLNITKQWAGPDLEPHNYRGGPFVNDVSFLNKTHLEAIGQVTAANAPSTSSVWGVTGDVDNYFKPIPEPTSLGLLSLGLLGLGYAGRRRKTA